MVNISGSHKRPQYLNDLTLWLDASATSMETRWGTIPLEPNYAIELSHTTRQLYRKEGQSLEKRISQQTPDVPYWRRITSRSRLPMSTSWLISTLGRTTTGSASVTSSSSILMLSWQSWRMPAASQLQFEHNQQRWRRTWWTVGCGSFLRSGHIRRPLQSSRIWKAS